MIGAATLQSLSELCGFADPTAFRRVDRQSVEQRLESGLSMRDDRWSESIAVGSLAFIDEVRSEIGFKTVHRGVVESDGSTRCGSRRKTTRSNLPLKPRL